VETSSKTTEIGSLNSAIKLRTGSTNE